MRTLVVQMPAAGSKGTGWNDPLLYPPEEMEDGVVVSRPGHGPNGWVVYTQGQQPKETLGGPNPSPNPDPDA